MGVQLIFTVETNKKCNSDWIYIKDTVEYFYAYERTQLKLSVVYLDGKGHYSSKKKQNEIDSLISQYRAASKTNQSKVICCFDCDDYDSKQEDRKFLEDAEKFGVKDKDVVSVKTEGLRGLTFHNVLVRASEKFALEMHVDIEEGNAAGVKNGDLVELIK